MSRTIHAALLAVVAAVVLAPTAAASSAAAPVSVVGIEPKEGNAVVVERVAAAGPGGAEHWRLNLDLILKNTGSRSITLTQVEIAYAAGGPAPKTVAVANDAIEPGAKYELNVPEDRIHLFPVADSVTVELSFAGYDTFSIAQPLAEYRNAAPGGSYPFPGRREDLPDGWYWTDTHNHVVGTDHRNTAHQRFAYDLSIRRWNGEEWTSLTKQAERERAEDPNRPKQNSDYLVFGTKLYAVADGTIVKCRRDYPENVPGVKGPKGNGLWIRTQNTSEYVFYAHMKQNTIPEALCPEEGDDLSIPVEQGQYLGRAGNSGSSDGPHLHFETDVVDANGKSQGRPLHFHGIRVRKLAGWSSGGPCRAGSSDFAVVKAAALDTSMLVEPLYRPGFREIARHGVLDDCYQDLASGLYAAGYQPTWLDGYDVGGKTYFNAVYRGGLPERPSFHGLTAAAYQTAFDQLTGDGYRPVLVESYLRGGHVRYALIAEKSPGPRFVAWHGLSKGEHAAAYRHATKDGYAPVAISVVSVGGHLTYTALLEKRDLGEWDAETKLTPGKYQKFLEDNAKDGRHLVYVNAYVLDGSTRFVAIVSGKASPKYAARHGLDAKAYQTEWETWTGKGLSTQAVTGYAAGGSHRFAALWR